MSTLASNLLQFQSILCGSKRHVFAAHLLLGSPLSGFLTWSAQAFHPWSCWSFSRSVMSDFLKPHGLGLTRLFCSWDSPGKNTGKWVAITFFIPQPQIYYSFHYPVLQQKDWSILCTSQSYDHFSSVWSPSTYLFNPTCSPAYVSLSSSQKVSIRPFPVDFIYTSIDTCYRNKSHSSTLAWKIPWTEEPGRLQSMGSLGVGHNWTTSLSLFTFMHGRRKWQPTPVFLPGESQGQGSLVGCRLWGHTESDTTEVT